MPNSRAARLVRTVVVVALAAAPAGCVRAADCAGRIPPHLRADAIRWAIDRRLVPQEMVPRDDEALALGQGTPYEALGEHRRNEVAPHAAGYGSCILERTNK